eukprot:15361620-Ditylum_brightwellii.AAC.1
MVPGADKEIVPLALSMKITSFAQQSVLHSWVSGGKMYSWHKVTAIGGYAWMRETLLSASGAVAVDLYSASKHW